MSTATVKVDTARIRNQWRDLYKVEFKQWTFFPSRDLTPE